MSDKVKLCIMMFLEYVIWGLWSPILSEYLITDLGFSGIQVGIIYSLLPLGTIIAPFIGGQLADRYFSTEKVIAFLQFVGAGLLVLMAHATDYNSIKWTMFAYCLVYAPTLALTNAMAFINLKNSDKEFGQVRVWGTIGWIAAGLMLAGWRMGVSAGAVPSFSGDMLYLAAVISILMGFQSLTLPHTPPKKEAESPFAFLKALSMFKDKSFVIFIFISFIVATELMFYYILTAPFLTSDKIGVPVSGVSGVMVIAQVAEIFVMAILLPYFLSKYGIRKTLALGVIAWPVRYIIFAIGSPAWLVIASLSLHGFCYVFFFTTAFIYVDSIAPKDIRASAQSMIAIVTLGIGNYLGSLFAGWIHQTFTVGGVTNWTNVFLVPCGITIFCALAFMIFFREEKRAN